MRLSLFTDLGLRVLMRMAGEPKAKFSARTLATDLNVSHHHLTKVVGALSSAGFLQSRRGHRGGVSLAVPASTILLGDVVRALEGSTPIVECFRLDGGSCTLSPNCLLQGRLARAHERFIDELNTATLNDVAYIASS